MNSREGIKLPLETHHHHHLLLSWWLRVHPIINSPFTTTLIHFFLLSLIPLFPLYSYRFSIQFPCSLLFPHLPLIPPSILALAVPPQTQCPKYWNFLFFILPITLSGPYPHAAWILVFTNLLVFSFHAIPNHLRQPFTSNALKLCSSNLLTDQSFTSIEKSSQHNGSHQSQWVSSTWRYTLLPVWQKWFKPIKTPQAPLIS